MEAILSTEAVFVDYFSNSSTISQIILFRITLQILYENEIIGEDCVQNWIAMRRGMEYDENQNEDEEEDVVVDRISNQLDLFHHFETQNFVTWIQSNDDEESDSDDDESGGESENETSQVSRDYSNFEEVTDSSDSESSSSSSITITSSGNPTSSTTRDADENGGLLRNDHHQDISINDSSSSKNERKEEGDVVISRAKTT